MARRIACSTLLLCAAALFTAPLPAAERPNVLLIMVDDMGAECLSCYGGREYATPNLDALAASGAKFTHCYSTPLCTPSRVQIMTGKYNFRNYVKFGVLPSKETTFGDLMRTAGYRTCVAGKWQLSGEDGGRDRNTDPDDWGFDEHCLWQLNNKAPGNDARGPRYWNPFLEQNGEILAPGEDAYGPDATNEFLLDFFAKNKDRPFFAYYPMILTHGPFEPTPDSADRGRRDAKYFKDMVEYMDKQVGGLVGGLDRLGLRERTVVIVTSDNGTGKEIETDTDRGVIKGGKGTTTDAGTHAPLIVSWPGKVKPATVTDRLVDFTDVVPTLLAVAGAKALAEFKTDGVPFLDANGLSAQQRDFVYLWYEPRHGENSARNNAIFARDRRFKLYADGRFFDLSKTPLERDEDRIGDSQPPEAAAARASLQKVIDRYAADGGVTSRPEGGEERRPRARRQRQAAADE